VQQVQQVQQQQQQQRQQHSPQQPQQQQQPPSQSGAMAHSAHPHAGGQAPSLQIVGGRLQSCQSRVVEAMQRCNSLMQSIR
jgi:hypothetical protein